MPKKLVFACLYWLTQLLYSYEFVVLIPSYNNIQWWEENLVSVLQQDDTRHQLRIIFIDDCSTDGTGLAVKTYLERLAIEPTQPAQHPFPRRSASYAGQATSDPTTVPGVALCEAWELQQSRDEREIINPASEEITHTHYTITNLTTGNHIAVDLYLNQKRQGALANIYRAVHSCPDQAVILTVDGDDQLVGTQVLQTLAKAYQAGNWLTYGQYLNWPAQTLGSCRPFLPGISFRHQLFRASHLRTFYAGLFKQIKLADLLDQHGQFYSMAWDLAFMLPMLEMSQNRYQFISKILYRYNRANSLSDQQTDPNLQVNLAEQIKRKPAYRPVLSYVAAGKS